MAGKDLIAFSWREAGLQEEQDSEKTDSMQGAEAAQVLWEGQLPFNFPRQPKGQVGQCLWYAKPFYSFNNRY